MDINILLYKVPTSNTRLLHTFKVKKKKKKDFSLKFIKTINSKWNRLQTDFMHFVRYNSQNYEVKIFIHPKKFLFCFMPCFFTGSTENKSVILRISVMYILHVPTKWKISECYFSVAKFHLKDCKMTLKWDVDAVWWMSSCLH